MQRTMLVVFTFAITSGLCTQLLGETAVFQVQHPGTKCPTAVSVPFAPSGEIAADRLAVVEVEVGANAASPVPAQLCQGRLWWILPPGDSGRRSFRVVSLDQPASPAFHWDVDQAKQYYTLREGGSPILRYNFGDVPMPPGRKPNHFGDGRPYGGARSDYVHPLYGFDGQVITEDYPEHPHHRSVWWSWPVVRWNDRVADIWAVCDVWARPEKIELVEAGPVMALLVATNLWKFGAEEPHAIVREKVVLRVFPTTDSSGRGRTIDIDLTLTALEDGVAFGGRPKAGYGGVTYRAMPAANQEVEPFVAEASAQPRAAWCRYSADFPGSRRRISFVLLQHQDNPGYPSAHNVYTNLNCFMPAFPGDAEHALPKGEPLLLRHRIWLTEGEPSTEELQKAWQAYQQ